MRPGYSVKRAVIRAVARAVPGYRLHDLGLVLDQLTGLCAVELRARNGIGDILVVSVESPAGHHRRASFEHVQTGFEVSPGSGTKYATVTSRAGFTVLVGATGPMRRLPADSRLIALAHDRALTW